MGDLRVLVTSPPFLQAAERYGPELESYGIELVLRRPGQHFAEAEMKAMIEDVDGIICGDDRITGEVLTRAKRLKVISKWGVGLDSIDVEAAEALNIPVCNSPGAFGDACADAAMGYVIMLARGLHRAHALMMMGRWEKVPGMLLRGRTLGIIGVGNIGRQVARRAVAFGLRVIGNDIRSIPRSFVSEIRIEMREKDELFSRSDFVVISCDLNPGTAGLIDAKVLRRMKNSAFLVNIARGPIVDTDALVKALRERVIAGAALDVFEDEPLLSDSELRHVDNCVLGAHNAYNADWAVENVHRNTIDNLLRHLCNSEDGSIDGAPCRVVHESGLEAKGAEDGI
jgi:D-3-phosphoglycerate dehydrogenase